MGWSYAWKGWRRRGCEREKWSDNSGSDDSLSTIGASRYRWKLITDETTDKGKIDGSSKEAINAKAEGEEITLKFS